MAIPKLKKITSLHRIYRSLCSYKSFIFADNTMIFGIKYILCYLILLCAVENAFCIKCWNCRSNNDPKCADPFDNSTVPITDCKQEKGLAHLPGVRPTMCRKIRQKVNGEWRYFRDCAYLGEVGIQGDERFCLMRTGTYNIFTEYCTCNSKDGCNSSIIFSPMPLLILLSSLAGFVCKMS